MSNHNKIRLVDKNNHSGKYKILFSTPQTKHTNIPKEFRGLQIYNNRSLAEEALKKRKRLDLKKENICKKLNIILIKFNYNESITTEAIEKKLRENKIIK